MIVRYSLLTLALLGAIALAMRLRPPADPMKTGAVIAERVLRAIEREDYDDFIAQGDNRVRRMRVENFRLFTERQAARLKRGHELRPLDGRWRGEVHVSRWKLVFKDGGPDAILTLGVRDGRVATFAIL